MAEVPPPLASFAGAPGVRIRVFEASVRRFACSGFESTTMGDVADEAGCTLAEVYSAYPSKVALALGLYQRVVTGMEVTLEDLPEGSLARRFSALMKTKLDLLDADRAVYTALIAEASAEALRDRILDAV